MLPCEVSVTVAGIKGEPDMKIFSICCVRGENDIVGETLKAALDWSDQIFVFDNGSTDGTWETRFRTSRSAIPRSNSLATTIARSPMNSAEKYLKPDGT